MLSLAALPLLLTLSARVFAWGNFGHQTVANVALQYISPTALTAVNKILAADPSATSSNPSMVDVATWADTYRYTTAGEFSQPWHFIDALDNPPTSCSVVYSRDCTGTGCIVSAIANYTSRVQTSSMSATDKAMAMKFIIHFMGDITQPLHDENLEYGGNDIDVLWQGDSTNLHHIWDTEMPEQLAGSDTTTNIDAWTNTIVSDIKTGSYNSSVASWISCITSTSIKTVSATETCATTWAVDANAFVCSYVLKTNPANTECSGSYYTGAAPIIQEQIAKGGVRLAAWLNMIYTGKTGF